MPRPRSPRLPLSFLGPALFAACSGGGGGSGGGGAFVLTGTNISNNQIWPLNRPIVFTFNHPVQASSANFASITFASLSAPGVTGSFFVDPCSDGSVLVFQPDCPSNAALDDGGFKPGGINYTLTVLSGGGANVLRDTGGKKLASGITITFKSPTVPVDPAFFDVEPFGPPVGSMTDLVSVPLNTFTAPAEPILVKFDQPIDPRPSNLATPTGEPVVQLQFEEPPASGTWLLVPSTLTLLSNCVPELDVAGGDPCPVSQSATVAVTPLGILPEGRQARILVKAGLDDIGGDQSTITDFVLDAFAIEAADPPPGEADAFDETFDDTALEDATSPLLITTPPAVLADWGDGVLRAAEPFPAPALTGAQQFNLNVAVGQTIELDTTLDTLVGTDGNGAPAQLTVVGGVVNLHNLTVGASATPGAARILGTGPNPLVFNCTGNATIGFATGGTIGEINVDGGFGLDVVQDSADQPDPGAEGNCGGGKGGDSSPDNSQSSQRGGAGTGAANLAGGGGRGGHSCFGTVDPVNRRGAGGGGGSFGTLLGLVGNPGGPLGTDALTGSGAAGGGESGPGAFTNGLSTDDFFGRKLVSIIGPPAITTIVAGELQTLRGGSGGGAGGDSVAGPTFPNPTFASPGTIGDEKGGRGGGGGGLLVIRCAGTFTLNATGVLRARGGAGGDGESTVNNPANRVGGGGGGGSGGMIVIEALTPPPPPALPNTPPITIATGTANNERLRLKGGAGGLGAGAAPTNAGGAGGDGVLQIHTPTVNATGSLTVLSGSTIVATLPTNTADILPAVNHILLPAFSRISRARTRWINTGQTPLGNAGGPFYEWVVPPPGTPIGDPSEPNNASNPDYPLDAPSGLVRTVAGVVSQPAPQPVGTVPIGSVADQTITIPLAALTAANFLNPAAMVGFELNPNSGQAQTFTIVSGTTSGSNAVFTTDPADGSMIAVAVAPTTPVAIGPRFFRVRTNGVEDSLPVGATVKILFEGATNVSPTGVVTGSTGFQANLDLLNGKPFIRAQVEFDLTGLGAPSSSLPRPEIEFIKLPIRF